MREEGNLDRTGGYSRRTPRPEKRTESSEQEETSRANRLAKEALHRLKKNRHSAWLVAGWTFIVIFVGIMVGSWWWSKLWTLPGMAFVVGFTLYGWMMRSDPLNPFRYTLASFLVKVVMPILLVLYLIFGNNLGEQVATWWKGSGVPAPVTQLTSSVKRNQSTASGPAHSAIVQKTISDAVFAQEWIPYKDKVGLVARAQEESGFRQFNDDGTILRGEVNNHDVCAFQINEDYWLEKAKELGHDIYTLSGCIEMALAIYKERGLDAWNTLKGVENVNKSERIIVAPVGKTVEEAGELIQVPVGSNCHGIPDKLVIVWDDNDQPHMATPTNIPTFFTTTLRYSTPDAPAGRITYGCR